MIFNAIIHNGWNGDIAVTADAGHCSLTVSQGHPDDGRVVVTAHLDREQLAQLIEALGTAYMGAPLERISPERETELRALEQFTRETMARCREAAKGEDGQ